jgi:hypothetical protein
MLNYSALYGMGLGNPDTLRILTKMSWANLAAVN